MGSILVKYAQGDQDVVEIHKFLLEVASPVLLGGVDFTKSLNEVKDIVDNHIALTAYDDTHIIGSLGLLKTIWWYGPTDFVTDRWFFVREEYHNRGVAAAMLGNVEAVATKFGVDCVINGHMRRRGRHAGRGILFTSPKLISPLINDETTQCMTRQ